MPCFQSNNYSRAYIVGDRNYNEEHDPDYKLPEDDKDWLSDLEELEEVEDNLEDEVKCLVEDAAVPVPERYFLNIAFPHIAHNLNYLFTQGRTWRCISSQGCPHPRQRPI